MKKGILAVLVCFQLAGCDWLSDEYIDHQVAVGELSRELFVECMTLASKIARQDSMNEISAVITACSAQASEVAELTVR